MKKKNIVLANILLVLVLILSACNMSTFSTSISTGVKAFVTGWDLHTQDREVGEVLVNNNNTLPWRQGFQQYLANGGKVDVFIDCTDGRVSAGSMYYAKIVQDGGIEPYRFEIGSLGGQVTPEIIQVVRGWVWQGWVRSINISSHTCRDGSCGIQQVKKDLEAGKTVADFESHGVGDSATWAQDVLDSSDPRAQVTAQVTKMFDGIEGRVPVFGWIADHGTQKRDLVVKKVPGVHPGLEFIFENELVLNNIDSAQILGPQAEAQGLNKAQSFRRIVITDSPMPVEMLVGTAPGALDEAFNISLVVPLGATEEQIQSALSGVKAAFQYSMAHATPETEVFIMIGDSALQERVLVMVKGMKAYQDFLLNNSFQEVVMYPITANGSITRSLLLKPAYATVSPEMTIGPEFRGKLIHEIYEFEGQQWAIIHGGRPEVDGAVMVTVEENGVYRFARTFRKFADAQFFFNGNLASDPNLSGLLSLKKFGNGGIVYMPDYGEELIPFLARTGRWSELPAFAQQIEQMLVRTCEAGFCSIDIYHLDQFMVNEADAKVRMSDWSPATTLSRESMLKRFGTPSAYQLYIQREVGGVLASEAQATELLRLGYPIRQYLPIQWSTLSESSFTFTGSALTIAQEQAAAFEKAIVDLGSTQPEVVASARNTLAGMGARQIDGQWVIFGQNSAMASGPIRFSSLTTSYPDGARAFVGYQTKNLGVIGLERTENVSGGMFGWRLYTPKLSLAGKTVMGVPVADLLAEGLNDALIAVSVTVVANDIKDVATQTQYMAVGPNTLQTPMDPPISANYQIFTKPSKWPYVSTSWQIPLENLYSGCNMTGFPNGCGAYLPVQQESLLVILGSLAGTTIPEQGATSVGLDGQSVLNTWSYVRFEDGRFAIWHNDQWLQPGTSIDFYETKLNEFGMWTIPYHAELQTSSCAGLCIQQVHGGEEFLFVEGAQPAQMDLCPQGNGVEDPCIWRP